MNCNCKDDCFLVKQLEKENAELKEAIKHFNPCGEWDDDVHDCEFRHYAIEYGSKLTKAKFLLKLLVDSFPKSYSDVVKDTLDETRKFIEEENV